MVFGKSTAFTATVSLSALDGTTGFKISGVDVFEMTGTSVSSAGDINGDGYDDLLIGARNGSTSYVIFGSSFTGAATFAGTSGNDSMNAGTAAAETFVAGQGNDTITGGGGADVVNAGQGNDRIVVANVSFRQVDGGSGTDTLALSGSSLTLDLTTMVNNRLVGIEIIELTGSGNNTLALAGADVLALSDSSNTLRVDGNAGDTVRQVGAWVAGGTVVIGSDAYRVFTQGAATLQIDTDITRSLEIPLALLDGVAGFKLSGASAGDQSGFSVASAGDVNGDGYEDLIIGAPDADPNGNASGASYVVFGKSAGFSANLDLSTLDGSNGFKLSGVTGDDNSGIAVSGAGDVNGDGYGDLIVGAPRTETNNIGSSYVVFGKSSGFAASLNLSTLDGTNGLKLTGGAGYDYAGFSVSAAGDINGDGYDDVVVGARDQDQFGSSSGSSYVVFGKSSGFGSNLDLLTLNTPTGFRLSGVSAGDRSGYSVSEAGDVNGDGYDDIIIGALYADPNGTSSGASYVVFGKSSTFGSFLNLSTLDGSTGFKISGVSANDRSGVSVGNAGDVNGDGYDDLIIGALYADPNGTSSGASYVVFGKSSAFAANLNLSTLNGTTGFRISGVSTGDRSGRAVSSAGDVNGDGYDDLIVGAYMAAPNGSNSGASYVVFGKSGGFAANFNLSALDGNSGFKLSGVSANDEAGFSVAAAGDVNGDGYDDLVVGARYADPNANADAGASYVVFGGNFTGAVTFVGTNGADTLNAGTSAAENFVAGAGNDTITGGGGADVIGAGAGNDRIIVPDLAFRQIDGGSGTDTLALGGSGLTLDLGTLASHALENVEIIDITGSGNNRLKLTGADVLSATESGNTLRVDGNAGDLVLLKSGGNWSTGGTTVLDNQTYQVYTQGAATLQVDTDVLVFTPDLTLASLNGTSGFALLGVSADDKSGIRVRDAGDINGDGYDDLIVGAPYADPNGSASGATYVVFGKSSGFDATLNLSALDGGNGFKLSGVAADDKSGLSISGTGDINGDGYDDLVVGAPLNDANGTSAGAGYVVFGKSADFAANLDLSALDGSNGFKLYGISAGDSLGQVSGGGDVNGDGYDDLIVAASLADPNLESSGATYVIFGRSTGFAANFDLSALDGSTGFRIAGSNAEQSGVWISDAGDVNGDGYDDVIIGVGVAHPNGVFSGASYVVFGKASGIAASMDLSALDGSNGFKLLGASAGDQAGMTVSGAGDVNGDGYDDLVVGARYADPNGDKSGASYVVFGKASGFSANLGFSALDGTNGFRISGAAASNQLGGTVSSAGDINADGYDDLIVGAVGAALDVSGSGASYVVYGKASGFGANFDVSSLDGANGFRLYGAAVNDQSGVSVSGAGDVNGDGYDDLLVGASFADPNGNASGASYVVFGGNFAGAVTFFGTNGADALDTGTSAAETFVSGQGNDTITGGGGADVVNAGAGNDRIVVSDLAFRQIDGGSGTDTLALSGSGLTLDLGTLANHRLGNIEIIELTGSGSNTLKLAAADVLALSESSNTLRVDGNAGDLVLQVGGWIVGGTAVIGSETYRLYTQGSATLQIDTDVGVAITNLPLGALIGANGFKLSGVSENDLSGFSAASAGDVNGDGYDDLIVGAPYADPNGNSSGATYVVFGKSSAFASTINLSALDGSNGFKLSGATTDDRSGASVGSAGDVNGDGFDDLIIGAGYADPQGVGSGASYVVLGKSSAFASNIDLSTLDGSNGFTLSGATASDRFGRSVSGAGDVNGDGFGDFIVGAPYASPISYADGVSYVVFGKSSPFSSNFDLSALDGTTGFRLTGTASGGAARSGFVVSDAGDVNGDGYDDLIVRAYNFSQSTSQSYVVFGKASGFAPNLGVTTLDGNDGFKLSGAAAGADFAWSSAAGAGDINGDGYDDLIVGADYDGAAGDRSGASYVVFGKASDFAANLDLATLNGSTGFKLVGTDDLDHLGWSAGSAGDFNGDGYGDIIVGTNTPSASRSGTSYILFGKAAGFGATVDVSDLEGTTGFRLSGTTPLDRAGSSVSGAGDVNGDGYDDLIVGAPGADPNGSSSGATYVVFGGNFSGGTVLAGTSAADALDTGTPAAETFAAGQGNDTVTGGGGADVVNAGEGNDRIVIPDLAFRQIDGGSGSDTLALSGSGLALDLTTLAHHRLGGIETIDLTGSGNNSLTLSPLQIIDLSERAGTVTILGNSGDTVTFANAGGWVASVVGAYHQYASSSGTVQFGNAVSLTLTGRAGVADLLYGTPGADTLDGLSGSDQLRGGNGNDAYTVDTQADLVFEALGEGTDTITSSASFYLYAHVENLTLAGSALFGVGNELDNALTGNAQENLLIGWGGDDTLDGGAARDTLFGVEGNDTLLGQAGIDYIVGGNGNDTIDGGNDADEVYGQDGNDSINGGSDFATDILVGGNGNDTIDGGPAWDLMYGNAGDDTFYVSQQVDWVFEQAGEGTDTVIADSPNGYYLFAEIENLVLAGTTAFGVGNELANTLTGNASANTLLGGSGNDTIDGKQGNDILWGQAGVDTFVFQRDTDIDVVADFVPGTDKIQIQGIYSSFAQLQSHMVQNGGSTAIDLALGDVVIIQGVALASLGSGDFLFA